MMSDVMLHIHGTPKEFLKWCARNGDLVILTEPIPAQGVDSDFSDADSHSLAELHQLPSDQDLKDLMGAEGCVYEKSVRLVSDRNCMFFRRSK